MQDGNPTGQPSDHATQVAAGPFRLQAYRCWLRPQPATNRDLFGFADARRWVWNACVAWMEEANLIARSAGANWAPAGAFSLTFLSRLLDQWCAENLWLNLVPKQLLQQALADFIKARAAFLSGAAEAPPRFQKAREATPTMRFPQHVQLNQNAVFLPKLGWVRLRNTFNLGRGIPAGQLRSATVKFEAGRWFVTLLMRLPISLPASTPVASVGLDYGVKHTLASSARTVLQAPVATKKEAQRILFLEHRLARCVPGSHRYAVALTKLNTFRSRITRRIHDWRHKTTTDLSKNHGLIAAEALRAKNMTASAQGTVEAPGTRVAQKAGLNRALLEPGFGILMQQLAYKQAWRGHAFIQVDPAYTSQTCPRTGCGHVHADNRPNRDTFRCVRCGYTDDADFAAADIILRRGKQTFSAVRTAPALAAGRGRDCAPGASAPRGHRASHSRTKPCLRLSTQAKGIPAF